MYKEGLIIIVQCNKCGATFPDFLFVGDTDMVTSGCISLSGKDNNVALTIMGPNETMEQVEARVGADFCYAKVRYEEQVIRPNISFQEFLKTYKPPTAIYTCITCGADAKTIRTESKEQFLQYGKIEIIKSS